jgi:hypothetical protein
MDLDPATAEEVAGKWIENRTGQGIDPLPGFWV